MLEKIISLNEHILEDALPPNDVGEIGERIATDYLRRRGFRIIAANFKVPVGRNRNGATVTGEIDLIALEEDILCIVEVKTRSTDAFASPLTAVDIRKQRQITRTARVYRRLFSLEKLPYRFDAVGIVLHDKRAPKIVHRRNYWSRSKFERKKWALLLDFNDYR